MGYSIPKSVRNTRYWGTQVSPGLAHGVTLYPRDNFAPTPPSPQGTRRYSFKDLAGYSDMGADEVVSAVKGDPNAAPSQDSLRAIAVSNFNKLTAHLNFTIAGNDALYNYYALGQRPVVRYIDTATKKQMGLFVILRDPYAHKRNIGLADVKSVSTRLYTPTTWGVLIKDLISIPRDILGFVGGTLKDIVGGIGCTLGVSDMGMLAASVGVAATGTPVPPEAVIGAKAAAMRMCAMKDPNYIPQNIDQGGSSILPIAAIGLAAYLLLRKR